MTMISGWAHNEARTKGYEFDGFTNPVTGQIHRPRILTELQHSGLMYDLVMSYISRFGIMSTGALDDTGGRIKPNSPSELVMKLEAAGRNLPRAMSKVDYGIWLSAQSQHVVRIVVLSNGDQKNIPPAYYDKFCFWFLGSIMPTELGNKFKGRFDAILNATAWEAREAARVSGVSSRQVFESILDQAFADAEVTLEPLLSHAPSEDHKLMLKTVVYSLLARKGLVPDFFQHSMNTFAHVAPNDYFASGVIWQWRVLSEKMTGFDQLVAESLLIPLQNMWVERQVDSFEEVQGFVEAVQFVEDLVVFIPRSRKVFELLLPK